MSHGPPQVDSLLAVRQVGDVNVHLDPGRVQNLACVLPDRDPLHAVCADSNVSMIVIRVLDAQPAPELQVGVVQPGAVDGLAGQVLLGQVSGIVPV